MYLVYLSPSGQYLARLHGPRLLDRLFTMCLHPLRGSSWWWWCCPVVHASSSSKVSDTVPGYCVSIYLAQTARLYILWGQYACGRRP
jgi:hypothetical protein